MAYIVEIENQFIDAGNIKEICWEYSKYNAYCLIVKYRNGTETIFKNRTLEQLKKLRDEFRKIPY